MRENYYNDDTWSTYVATGEFILIFSSDDPETIDVNIYVEPNLDGEYTIVLCLKLWSKTMYIVRQVNKKTNTYYEGTEREIDKFEPAVDFLMQSFKNMYGTETKINYEFWDPENQKQSAQLYSIKMYEGWYLY